jgi:hypothetical protein
MEKFVFERKYEDGVWLEQQYAGLQRSSKDIAKELHISYKLVEIYLAKFNIPVRQEFN